MSPDWTADKPDLFLDKPYEVIDVKTLDDNWRVSVRAEQLEKFTRDYGEFYLALWSSAGRLKLPPEEFLERAVPNGDSLVHQPRNGRTPYYLFDMVSDQMSFSNPFAEIDVLDAPELPETLQLSLDGRAVESVNAARLGESQREVLRVLQYRPMTSTEIGHLLHALHGSCPAYQRQDRYPDVSWSGDACCRKAVDLGSTIMGNMRRQGRVRKIGSYWTLPVEVWA